MSLSTQQTNTQFFTRRMSFLSPNQQCQSTEGIDSVSLSLSLRFNGHFPGGPGGVLIDV